MSEQKRKIVAEDMAPPISDIVSQVPDSLAVRRESGQTVYYVSCKLAKKSLAC